MFEPLGELADGLVHDAGEAAEGGHLLDAGKTFLFGDPPDVGGVAEKIVHQHVGVEGGRLRQVADAFFQLQGLA